MNIWIAGLYTWNYCCQERKRFFLTLRAYPVTALSLSRCLPLLHITKLQLRVVIVFPGDFYTGHLLQGNRHLTHLGSLASNIYSNTIRQYWLSECCWVSVPFTSFTKTGACCLRKGISLFPSNDFSWSHFSLKIA